MYCTLEDILLRFASRDIKELTQDDNASTEIDTSRTDVAISDACELIDSKIFKKYNTPLSPVPNRIKRIAAEIAVYYIYKLRYEATVPEQIEKTFTENIAYLNAIKNGDEELAGLELKDGNEFIVLSGCADFKDAVFSIEELEKI